MTRKIIFLSLYVIVLISCERKVNKNISGVVLTFDDKYIDEWYMADSALKQYNWKATFFVTQINTLTPQQIDKLHFFVSEGHSVEGHGYKHLNAADYIDQNGIDSYFAEEIQPMIDYSDSISLHFDAFAYPYGANTKESDDLLLQYFKIIRKCDWKKDTVINQLCFFNKNRIIYGFPIDNYNDEDMYYIYKLIDYAYQNNLIVVFYSHKPVKELSGNYQITIDELSKICEYVKNKDMKFYTIDDLINFLN